VKNLPNAAIQVKSPEEDLRSQHESQLKALDAQAERNAFKDKVWKAALAALSITEACQLLRMDLQALLPLVKQDFGTEWEGLIELARITTRCDLSSAAIKGARNGDTRLLIRLMDEGFFVSINGVGTLGEVSFSNGLRQMSLEQLKTKRLELAAVIDRKPVLEDSVWSEKNNESGPLVTRDATPEEKTAFEKGETSQITRDFATAFSEPKKKAPELSPDEQLAIEAAQALQEVL